MIRDLLQRWNERRKLTKGQCVNCGATLPDDARDPYCSNECAEEWTDKLAW